MAQYLITYDIANPKRLARLHRALKKRAMPIQYSVFLAELSPAGLAEVRDMINGIIHAKQDDVRIYPLPAGGWRTRLGEAVLPAGISCTLLPAGWDGAGGPEAGVVRNDGEKASQGGVRQPVSQKQPAQTALSARVQTGQRRGIQLLVWR